MIKKFIFSLAIMLSLTTHHAVCIGNEDDEFDIPTISAQLRKLDEQRRKEVQRNCELNLKEQEYTYHNDGGVFLILSEPFSATGALKISNDQILNINTEINTLRKKLVDLLLIVSLD